MMMVNNEIGALEPIENAGEIIKNHNPATVFHVDAIQAYGKFQIIPKRMHIDLLSVSGHKIHGPKGISTALSATLSRKNKNSSDFFWWRSAERYAFRND